MKYAVKFFGDVDNPDFAPSGYPAVTCEVGDDVESMPGYVVMTQGELFAVIDEHADEYAAWVDGHIKPRLIESLRDSIDHRTDEMIAAGYIYPPAPYPSGIQFKMDLEHQMSYKGAYDFRAYISYPYTIKGVGEHYLTFQNEGEFTQFILYGFGWMDATLRYGWILKGSLEGMSMAELTAWTDPRG